MFTYIYVSIIYSYGMPILYPICAFNFILAYWIEKTYLLRFYQKTKEFDQDLPIRSISLIKYVIFLHYLMSCMFCFMSSFLDTLPVYTSHWDTSILIPPSHISLMYTRLYNPLSITIYAFILFLGAYKLNKVDPVEAWIGAI